MTADRLEEISRIYVEAIEVAEMEISAFAGRMVVFSPNKRAGQ